MTFAETSAPSLAVVVPVAIETTLLRPSRPRSEGDAMGGEWVIGHVQATFTVGKAVLIPYRVLLLVGYPPAGQAVTHGRALLRRNALAP